MTFATKEGASGPLLTATKLTKDYDTVRAVDSVDFTLQNDSFVTILGPSGCGKTSILRMIGGFESVSAGAITLDDADITAIPAFHRPVNTVFQQYALFPHLTVRENVAFGLKMTGKRDNAAARVDEALGTVRMEPMADRYPGQLSGGQQQRIALARAFVNQPRLLLLDEPLSALDRKMRKHMQIELKDLQRRLGMTFFYVTHDQDEAFALSDWMIVMNHGVIEQQAEPETIYNQPANAYVADFIGGANLVPVQVTATRDGTATAETPFGPLECPCATGVRAGTPAVLCLRAEHLSLPPAEGHRPFQAVVTHALFQGDRRVVTAEAFGSTLTLAASNATAVETGVETTLGFDTAHAWIAPA